MSDRRQAFPLVAVVGVAAMLSLVACGGGNSASTPTASVAARSTPSVAATALATSPGASALVLTSDAFTNGGTIPVKYSCSGAGASPALSWTGEPASTKSYTLIVHDPDAPLAGGFTHWIVIDLPSAAASLPAAVPAGSTIAGGGGSQLIAYRGMCPPVGAAAHHYHFRLYALDAALGAAAGTTKDSVEAAMQGHILAQTELVGIFGR